MAPVPIDLRLVIGMRLMLPYVWGQRGAVSMRASRDRSAGEAAASALKAARPRNERRVRRAWEEGRQDRVPADHCAGGLAWAESTDHGKVTEVI